LKCKKCYGLGTGTEPRPYPANFPALKCYFPNHKVRETTSRSETSLALNRVKTEWFCSVL